MGFFKKTPQIKIGLDIGTHNLKFVALEPLPDNKLQMNALGMKEFKEDEDLSEIIKQLFAESGIAAQEVTISLAGESVVARHLSLPKMSEQELKKSIEYSVEDSIPFKIEDIFFDYRILGEEPTDKNKIRVFLVATKKDILESRIETVRKAGLEPTLVTVDALALKNTLYFSYPEEKQKNITILNIGNKITNILILKDGEPYFVRDTRFGGETVTTLLQTKLELDTHTAEELKYNLKDASADTMRLIKGSLANLLNEIFVSLDFFENMTEQKINAIYACGGSSQLFGLKEFLTGYLGIELVDLNPIKNLTLAPSLSQEKTEPLLRYFAVAVGLALE